MTTYEAFLKARAKNERLAGQVLVESIEQGRSIDHFLGDTGKMHGTDRDARTLIFFSRVSKARKTAALKALGLQ